MNNNYTYYADLIKPSFAPPAYLFGPVWTFLYIIILVSFGYIFFSKLDRKIKIVFALNLVFNFIFTPIQFGLRSNLLAAIDILLVLGTLVWSLKLIYPHKKWVSLVNIPYLLWVSFATILQISVLLLN